MNKIYEIILTFFYIGKIEKAQGTWGALAGLIFWLFLSAIFFIVGENQFWQNMFWFMVVIFLTFIGIEITPKYMKNNKLRSIDDKTIVLDEVVGQIITLQMGFTVIFNGYINLHFNFFLFLILSFGLFRLFDIQKPFIIGKIDKKLKNSLGVFLDDIVSGLVAGLLVIIVFKFLI